MFERRVKLGAGCTGLTPSPDQVWFAEPLFKEGRVGSADCSAFKGMGGGRMNAVRPRTKDRHQQILDAAARVITERGLAETRPAAAAIVSHGRTAVAAGRITPIAPRTRRYRRSGEWGGYIARPRHPRARLLHPEEPRVTVLPERHCSQHLRHATREVHVVSPLPRVICSCPLKRRVVRRIR